MKAVFSWESRPYSAPGVPVYTYRAYEGSSAAMVAGGAVDGVLLCTFEPIGGSVPFEVCQTVADAVALVDSMESN